MKLLPISIKHLPDQFSIKNSVYLSTQLAKNPSKVINVKIQEYIFKCGFHKDIQKGKIGMSASIRKFLNLQSQSTPVLVQPYQIPTDKQTGLSYLQLAIELVRPKQLKNTKIEIQQEQIVESVKKQMNYYFNPNQQKYFQVNFKGKQGLFSGKIIKSFLIQTGNQNQKKKNMNQTGRLTDQTQIKILGSTYVTIKSQSSSAPSIFRPDFNIADMGIGGLNHQLFDIFRRTFASRRFSNETVKKFGIKHVKGILLYGPPGTGKTLIARQLAKALDVKDLKIVNGPQIFSRYVGQSEQNIRKLFAEAKQDQAKYGDKSPLHIIVFDEIDAICKQRGMSADTGSQVGDQVVNQLLTNIDGVEALNNIVVIGMTNRKDLIDEAILRPGRFQVHVEVSLPNQQGRQQILSIHTKQLQKHNLLDSKCRLNQLARLTKNFTGAQIEALVKSATSHSISRSTNILDFSKQLKIDESKIGVKMQDFLKALQQVRPQFGFDQQKFNIYFREKVINYGSSYQKVLNSLTQGAQMKDNVPNQKRTILLYGKNGTGKTLMSLNFAKHSKFSYVKFIAPQNFIGMSDNQKVRYINKIFQNAYKTTSACIVIDSLQKIVNHHPLGRRFSNAILQALLVLIQKIPPNQSSKLLIIGTTASYYGLTQLQLVDRFDIKLQIPELKPDQISSLLQQKYQISSDFGRKLGQKLKGISISKLVQLGDMIDNKNDLNEWMQTWENFFHVKEESNQIEAL